MRHLIIALVLMFAGIAWAGPPASPPVDVSGAITTHSAASDPHTGYMLESNVGTGANNYVKLGATPGTPDGTKFFRDDGTWVVPTDTNTNANTICTGSTTYLDGDGNCDDISGTYASLSNLGADPITCTTGDVVGTNCGVGIDMRLEPVVQIASGTVELMAVTQGRACVICTTAAVCHIDPNASDRFVLSGTALADGDKLSSDGTIGARICFYKDSADGWSTMGNPDGHWADGN